MRSGLVVSAILNLLSSLVWISIGMPDNTPVLSIGMFLVIIGVLCLMYSKLDSDKLYEKRKIVLTFGVVLIPFNFISAIILLIVSDRIGTDNVNVTSQISENASTQNEENEIIDSDGKVITPTVKNTVNKEVKKVDTLLKIGIAMVAISGVMIATTSWDAITDFVKMLIIAIIGVVFLGLSFFSEKKLKIRSTTITYWFLSMIAFSLSIFMIGNFGLVGEWFSVNSDGADIFISVLLLSISLFSYLTYKRFDMTFWFYAACFGTALALSTITSFVAQDKEVCVLIFTVLTLLINIIPKSEKTEIKIIKLFGIVMSFITTVLLIGEEIDPNDKILVLITAGVQILNLVLLSILDKRDEIKILSGIGIISIVTMGLTGIYFDLDEIIVMLINRSIILLVAILICGLIVRNKKVSTAILGIVLPILILSLIWNINIAVAVYIGCITLAMIIFGFINKEFKVIYIEGIIFLVANLIIQLWEFWGLLPIWVYLLIGGLTLISIVTVKELKKGDGEK
ncbi:MAG: hypothetical protein IJ690_06425 [Clostridia bacterium]|nr:hypothetical protein [Clostridia bacterium]